MLWGRWCLAVWLSAAGLQPAGGLIASKPSAATTAQAAAQAVDAGGGGVEVAAESDAPVASLLSWYKAEASSLRECGRVLGMPKFAWAVVCDVLAVLLVLVCVPLLVGCSRRRPPGSPMFDFSGISAHCPKLPPAGISAPRSP
ncbi:unnamed protein product [Prorocentrum cordatum]|nr:unnamed protein product [Polarella glacialis]|mmetsp:Transcript_82986/g.216602  ORF Transcript_82986/g.216602 Transcript_82986/m.216602 type:complete len:143 (+) Transcript_82986:128-556(+)